LFSLIRQDPIETESDSAVGKETFCPGREFVRETHVAEDGNKAVMIDVVKEALDIKQEDPTLEPHTVSRLDIME